jgi:hypothetical protein
MKSKHTKNFAPFQGNHVVAMLEALSKLNAQQPEDNTTMDLASWINKAS